jgi:hypothetical protein
MLSYLMVYYRYRDRYSYTRIEKIEMNKPRKFHD